MKNLLVFFHLVVGVSCEVFPFPFVANGCISKNDCPTNEECDHGKCIRLHHDSLSRFVGPKACSTGADCGSQSVCFDGKCILDNGYGGKKCSVGAHCPNGYNCVNARCVLSNRRFILSGKVEPLRESCKSGDYCDFEQVCEDGKCVEISEILVKHRSGHGHASGQPTSPISFAGPKLCSTGADCGSQSVCVDGKCVVDNGYGGKCSVGAHCPNGYNCVNARCVPSSRRFAGTCQVYCPIGTYCQYTSCLPFPGK
ncbi:hypothetical protein CRE_25221 [Caenorhabditis remanei]|uniref:DUF7107 domain-containing protein n=1 Tax=Caenorhabditis remanei TaxID=31234 RepID=E3LS04_CAERE|nr:hypothetical protein CRE_25221 [Caenorhabditis remanei]